jgi:hypothetical protein
MGYRAQKLLDGRSRSAASRQPLAGVVFGLIVVHGVFSAARIALLVEDRRLVDRLRAHPDGVTAGQLRSHRTTLSTMSDLDVVPTFLVLVAVLVWFTLLRRAIKAAGDTGKVAVSPWIYNAFWVAVFVWAMFGTAAALAAPDPTDLAAVVAFDQWQIRRAAARLAVAGFLLFAVWMIHRRGARITAA